MNNLRKFYIDGQWVDPLECRDLPVENPATGEQIATTVLGGTADVERAIVAARNAFEGFCTNHSRTAPDHDGKGCWHAIWIATTKWPRPLCWKWARQFRLPGRPRQIRVAVISRRLFDALREYRFEEDTRNARVVREPVGVCGFICPWNWPINQIVCKVAPALAAGCTMVVKPSEETPLSARLFTEIIHEAGIPAGVLQYD